jgi:hypothetical protein
MGNEPTIKELNPWEAKITLFSQEKGTELGPQEYAITSYDTLTTGALRVERFIAPTIVETTIYPAKVWTQFQIFKHVTFKEPEQKQVKLPVAVAKEQLQQKGA